MLIVEAVHDHPGSETLTVLVQVTIIPYPSYETVAKAFSLRVATSGGTESILMSVKTHRDWAKATKGITEPEM